MQVSLLSINLGDFTYHGKDDHFTKFFDFLDKLKFNHKIVISGNHENVLSTLKLKSETKVYDFFNIRLAGRKFYNSSRKDAFISNMKRLKLKE